MPALVREMVMKHFTDEAWLDFARRLLPPEEMRRMQAHLDEGCKKCLELSELWEAVIKVADREWHYEPDEAVVDAVKAAFAGAGWRPLSPVQSRMAILVFDSFVDAPAVAGIRSISSTARHLLYQVGRWTIDLRLDIESGDRMTIAGQALKPAAKSISASHGDVVLMRGDTVLARASTNQFGEFQLECDCSAGLRINIEVPGQEPISIALPDSQPLA